MCSLSDDISKLAITKYKTMQDFKIGDEVFILDKGECMSTINDGPFGTLFKDDRIRVLAGKSEWSKHNFYPENGMKGIVVDIFVNPIFGFSVYVLHIENKYYVPMSKKGITKY